MENTKLYTTLYIYIYMCVCVCVCVFKVRAADGDPRGLLWVLDEEMVTPASSENSALERVCQYYSNTGKNHQLVTHTHTHIR